MERKKKKKRSETQISAAPDDTKESEDSRVGGEGKTVGSV